MVDRLKIAAPVAMLLVAACSGGGTSQPEANGADAIDNAANATADLNATAPDNNASASVDLTPYVGKHPSEDVDGVSFLAQPAVKAAVAATVADVRVKEFVFNYNGPDAPIVNKDGRILAWGCEAHNCGFHNWSISITPNGGSADVCFYHDDNNADGPATWYLADGKTEERPGNCPSE